MKNMDLLEKHKKELLPYAITCVLAEILKSKGITLRIRSSDIRDSRKTLCCISHLEYKCCCLSPIEMTSKEIRGIYKISHSQNENTKMLILSLKKIGMSFGKMEVSYREKDNREEKARGGKFILRLDI